jgi:hypothetical protein
MRVVAARLAGRSLAARIHLHPTERQYEYAKCEQACNPNAKLRYHGSSIVLKQAVHTPIARSPPRPTNALPQATDQALQRLYWFGVTADVETVLRIDRQLDPQTQPTGQYKNFGAKVL